MPRSVAVKLPRPSEAVICPPPLAVSVRTILSSTTSARTPMPAPLMASRTSLTLADLLRSISAVAPVESVRLNLPRRTPAPPLRSASPMSESSRPLSLSNVNEVAPNGEESRSEKPLLSCCCVVTRRSTMNWYEPGWALVDAVAVITASSELVALEVLKTLSLRKVDDAVRSAERRVLMSRYAACWVCSCTSRCCASVRGLASI